MNPSEVLTNRNNSGIVPDAVHRGLDGLQHPKIRQAHALVKHCQHQGFDSVTTQFA
jgi:hypothetical protein